MTDKSVYVVALTDPPPLSGRVGQTPWARANVATIDLFPWYADGLQQLTYARLLYDREAIYVQFLCQDKHISAERRELNGPVCNDSCVEFFAMFDPADGPEYFNLEVNCCGAFHLGLGVVGPGRRLVSQELASRVSVVTSIDSETKQPAPDDDGWWAAAAIPFDVLSEFAGKTVKPTSGDEWKVNFYRCGGVIDPQHACWAPIDLAAPDFHHHRFFREIIFG